MHSHLRSPPRHEAGRLPGYLVARKASLERADALRAQQALDPSCPPGHTLVPDADRIRTLNMHEARLAALMAEVRALSITADTARARAHRADLEARISQTEDAVRFFSRSKVYVKTDD